MKIKLPRKRKKDFLAYYAKKHKLKNNTSNKQAKQFAALTYLSQTIVNEILYEEKSLLKNTRYPKFSEKDNRIYPKRDDITPFYW